VVRRNGLDGVALDPVDELLPTARKLSTLGMRNSNIYCGPSVKLPHSLTNAGAKMPECTPEIALHLGQGFLKDGSLQSLEIVDILGADMSGWKKVAAAMARNGIKFKASGRDYRDPNNRSFQIWVADT
jgi:hypothetical protein